MLPTNLSLTQPLPPTPQMALAPAQVVVSTPGIVQTFQAVRSTPVGQAVENNTSGNNPKSNLAAPANQNTPSATPAANAIIPPIPAALNGTGGISPLFLAQLMAQSSGNATQILLAGYEQMLAVSQVKYKPSDATLPPPPGPGDTFKALLAGEAPLAQRLANTQMQAMTAQQANENAARPAPALLTTNITSSARSFEVAPNRDLRRSENNPSANRLHKSLLSDTGVHAYRATSTRNVIHLEVVEPVSLVG